MRFRTGRPEARVLFIQPALCGDAGEATWGARSGGLDLFVSS